MISVYDELNGKTGRSAARAARDGARRDLGLLLFARRDELCGLWKAAEGALLLAGASADLRAAVEKLRPLFGERTE